VWQSVNARFGFSDGEAEKFRADFFAGDVLDAKLAQFIYDLRPRYKTAILSNAWLDLRRMLTEHFHLVDAVDTIVISAEEGMVKPDARIYQIAATRLGVMPHEAIFVDDFVENVRGAQAVGMRAVHFKNAAQAMADVTEMLANS
jgi:epoxide hydrolase-like predicted phosphatase